MFNFSANYHKYGEQPSSWDVMKALAIFIMIIDHIGAYFFPEDLWWRAVGHIASPIWFFFAGYARPAKAQYEILILAVLLIATDLAFGRNILPVNTLVSIVVCRWFIQHIEQYDRDAITFALLAVVSVMIYVPTMVMFEYGSMALLFAVCGYYYRQNIFPLAHTALVFSTVMYVFSQQSVFHFDMLQLAVLAVPAIIICWLLSRFTIRPVTTGIATLDKTIMFAGRNSLYIYFLHLLVFSALEWAFSPDSPAFFTVQWLQK